MADPTKLPADLRPIWEIVSQECSAKCLEMLEPHLSMFVRVADLANQQGIPKLRSFLRCIGRLHDRAEHAEKISEHWQSEWEESYRRSLELQRGTSNSTLGYEVQVSDLQRALAARGAECERQQAELHRLQDAFQATADQQLWHRHGQMVQLRQLWGVTSSHLARSGELERMLSLERAESQRLRGAVAEAELAARTAQAETRNAQRNAAEAERYARDARAHIQEKVDEALLTTKTQLTEEFEMQRKAWRQELAAAIPLKLAREVLSAYAELWRCGFAASPGLHAKRAERALRRLLDLDVFAGVIPPRDELLQEPLRRAMGHDAAKDLGEALVAELQQSQLSTYTAPSDLHGWSRTALPSRAKAMVAANQMP